MRDTMIEAVRKPGFSFVEIISPCPTGYARRNKLGEPLDLMRFYKENSVVSTELDPENTALPFKGKVAVGKFVDIQKPTFMEMYESCVVARAKGKG
jgi:2-oxoglutarate ferredoxin oxidoreductase subunit beta